jgi:Tol biopolymer transport system component
VYDDRALRRSAGWRSVAAAKASRRTLTCSSKSGATLTVKVVARNGGALLVQKGARRGSVEVKVAGRRKALIATAATRQSGAWLPFGGAGTVVVRVVSAGRGGVCVDAVRLNPALPAPAKLPGAVRQLDLSSGGAGANDEVINAAVSPGGTMVAFWSRANNLLAGVTDGRTHLFLSRVATGRVFGVVDTSAGNQLSDDGDSSSGSRAVAWAPVEQGHADSRFVLFSASASNLGATPAGPGPWLWAKNIETGAVVGVVSGTNEARWSPNGRWIAFRTDTVYGGTATDPNVDADVWALDLDAADVNANLHCVSCDAAGRLPTGNGASPTDSYEISWSPDSTRVMFDSYAHSLVGGDTNVSRDVFVKNVLGGGIVRVSTSGAATQADNYSEGGTWSPNGASVAFSSAADNLVPGDTNSAVDVFVKTLSTGAVRLVSSTSAGRPALFGGYRPQWSPDGTRVAFMSQAVNLLPAPLLDPSNTDVYVKNLATGRNQVATVLPDGRFANNYSSLWELGGFSNNAWLPNGRGIVFASDATNLAGTDANAFGRDLFLKAM